jgi:hypothetical protein
MGPKRRLFDFIRIDAGLPLRAALAILLLAALAGCNKGSPSEPEHKYPALLMTCSPEGVRVSCIARLYDVPDFGSVRDVTSQATWLVSDPALGSFLQPGIFTPRQRGEVGLSARYEMWTSNVTSRFLVDPSQPAQWLYYLYGYVRDDASNAYIPGATVEMLDGYARGARSVTDELGNYKIDDILTGETFHVKASKPGYLSLTLTYRVDPPVGPAGGNSPFLEFRLHRTP